MPVWQLECPDCGHEYRSLVLAGTRPPQVWVCSKCGSEAVAPKGEACEAGHPLDSRNPYRSVCPCCGL